jgi:hypothetical protein
MKDKALTPEEFAKKYCNETTYMGKSNTKLILVSNKDGLLSDLNALIDFDREFTTDELYQYWTNNTNKFKQ